MNAITMPTSDFDSPRPQHDRGARLAGRRILIAGASGNIGSAVAARLAREGAELVLHYQSNDVSVRRLQAQIRAESGVDAATAQGGLDQPGQAGEVFAEAARLLGGVDVIVNCIGLSRDNSLLMLTEDDAAAVIRGNLAPVVYLTEAMIAQDRTVADGRIINVASITGLVGQPMRSLYGAAKGAVMAYTKSIAREVAGLGWTANCIAPQVVSGGLAAHMKNRIQTLLAGATPVPRACTPEDLTGLAAFLAAKESGFVTGAVLNVSGGLVTW